MNADEIMKRARARVSKLEMWKAARNLFFVFPIAGVGWVLGRCWYTIKLIGAVFIEGFRDGASGG